MSDKRTPQQAKTWLYNQGYSIRGWARANGFNPDTVKVVLSGKSKMFYGESRRCAIALDIQVPDVNQPMVSNPTNSQ